MPHQVVEFVYQDRLRGDKALARGQLFLVRSSRIDRRPNGSMSGTPHLNRLGWPV
jgi:hypothetical protein